MGAIPLLPASRLSQTSGAVLPTPHTIPMPVTTTRLAKSFAFRVLLDVFRGILHGLDFFRIFVRNLKVKGFLELHHEFNHVERVCAQIFLKRCAWSIFGFIDLKLLDDNLL